MASVGGTTEKKRRASETWKHLESKNIEHTHEDESEAHRLFRSVPGHEIKGTVGKKDTTTQQKQGEYPQITGVVSPGSTGVLYCSERATANGWSFENEEWANFGQGAPEVGAIPGGSERPSFIDLNALGAGINEYAPANGTTALRKAVAKLYNEQYRVGMESQYTADNVCIVPGGRAGLTRVASVISDVFVSYQIPEYTAYDQMLSSFRRLVAIPTTLSASDCYHLNVEKLKANISEQGLSVVVASNPRNPTGQVIKGDELKELVEIARGGTTMVLDEFYSWYQYELEEGESVSAAAYVKDVNVDSLVIIDGLTKNWRLPGWRCCWVIGPKPLISALGQAGGSLDGGANHVLQEAALPLLELSRVKQDRIALQRHFKMKRDHVLSRLDKMGLKVHNPPTSTFYIWLDLSQLPSPLNSGLVFFEELLKEKVIVVPGIFFDINPSHRRNLFQSPTHNFVRLSFGPALEELDRGLDGFERLLKRVSSAVEDGDDVHEVVGKNLA
ncbi:aminotransferase [Meredithblackwellia eburnea MCA 4105]